MDKKKQINNKKNYVHHVLPLYFRCSDLQSTSSLCVVPLSKVSSLKTGSSSSNYSNTDMAKHYTLPPAMWGSYSWPLGDSMTGRMFKLNRYKAVKEVFPSFSMTYPYVHPFLQNLKDRCHVF